MAGETARGPRRIGALLPKITGKVLAKHGFPDMSLLTEWAAIVGPELAAHTLPEKLTWPRRPQDAADDEAAGRGAPRHGITLRLRVESHRALDVQYATGEIIARINSYFGYRAVTDIRLIQGPVKRRDEQAREHPDHIKCRAKAPLADFSTIEDESLREALMRLDAARRG